MDPITLAILGAIMMASMAGMSAYTANAAAKRNEEQQAAALAMQQQQAAQQADVEAEKVKQQAHQIESRIRVAAGESGIGLGGTYQALTRQANMDESYNLGLIEQNRINAQMNIASQFQEQPRSNPLLAGIMGGIQGANMGLNLYGSSMNIQRSNLAMQQVQAGYAQPFYSSGASAFQGSSPKLGF
jgi:hypothetical protein